MSIIIYSKSQAFAPGGVSLNPPSFDAQSATQAFSTDSASASHTTTTESNRVIYVGVVQDDTGVSTPADPTSVTYDSLGLTKIASQTVGDTNLSLWRRVAPSTGSNSVAVTLPASVVQFGWIAVTYYNVDQTTPEDATTEKLTNTSAVTSLSDSITTVTDKAMGFQMFNVDQNDNTPIGVTGSETIRRNFDFSSLHMQWSDIEKDPAGSLSMGVSMSSFASNQVLFTGAIRPIT